MYKTFTVEPEEATLYLKKEGAYSIAYSNNLFADILHTDYMQKMKRRKGAELSFALAITAVYLAGRAEGKRDERKRRQGAES